MRVVLRNPKRHLFDEAALATGHNLDDDAALATGHSLDDGAAALMANTLRWQTGCLGRQLRAATPAPVRFSDRPGR